MPEVYPKISIVTAVFNQVAHIEDTILSILNQHYPNLEYIIIDGGSTDGTVEIIKKYEKYLGYWISEKDDGLYDALQKGFQKTTGEIMGWLNSDDILHRKSLFIVSDIFQQFNTVSWLQGYPSVIDEQGRIVYSRPPRFSKYSFYLQEYHDGAFIQQESTYWRRSLWDKAGSAISTKYKFAADFELWMRFFLQTELVITKSLIGAFRVRDQGQMSSDNFTAYMQECDEIIQTALKNLPSEELSAIGKMRKRNNLKNSSPFLEKIWVRLGFLKKEADTFTSVDFDLREKRFKINKVNGF